MKVCFVGSADSVHTRRWLKFFVEAGDKVHLLAPTTDGSSPLPGVTVHRFRNIRGHSRAARYLGTLAILPAQRRHFRGVLQDIRPDLVHAHYVNDGALFATMSGVRPLVVTAWGSDVLIEPRQSRLRRWAVQYVLRHADLITCDAEHVRRALIDLGARADSIEIVMFGTDTEQCCRDRRDSRLRAELSEAGPIVTSVRSLEPIYDVRSLVAAAPNVLAKWPDTTFVVAGRGSEEAMLTRLARELGVLDRFRFVGWLSETDLPRYLASADVYVSTALSDAGLAASTAEAMASEVPVVVTDVCDNASWVQDGESGLLIPPGDANAIAKALLRLFDDRELGRRLGRRGRQIIETRNSWRREMARMRELYVDLGPQRLRPHRAARST